MTTIFATITHGSHLFGTATEDSDRDYKTVLLPDARAILLGRANESWIKQTKDDLRARNTSLDVDHEHHLLLRYVQLLAAADPMALEMLFAPERFHVRDPHPLWKVLQDNADRIVTRQVTKFAGFCRDQASSYEAKADRLETAESLERFLSGIVEAHGRQERLSGHISTILDLFPNRECVTSEVRSQRGSRAGEILHLSMFGKLVAETETVATALDRVQSKIRDYGERTRRAREVGGKEWKNLSHSVRAGYEALELHTTGRLEFPSRKAPRLLAIKKGLVPLAEVLDEVSFLLEEMPRVSAASRLPESADLEFLEGIVADAHMEQVMAASLAQAPAPA